MLEVLLPDGCETKKDIEKCASYLYSNFGSVVVPIMGHNVMVEFTFRFPGSKIRLLGSSEKKFKSALLYAKKKNVR